MNDKKQIEEIAKILNECCNEYDEQGNHLGNKCASCECWSDTNHVCVSYNAKEAEALYNAGYRKQSENTVEIETVKKWLYKMAINNVGCYLEGDFATACEQIISRLDGLKRFAEEMKGGAE